jgi:hypothetical protein
MQVTFQGSPVEVIQEAVQFLALMTGRTVAAPVVHDDPPGSKPEHFTTGLKAEPTKVEPTKAKVEEAKVPEYVNDIVAFRAEIKRVAVPLMNDEEKALPAKEGEMALVKRLFAAAGVKNSQSVDGAKRQEFIAAIPTWLK